MKIQEIDINWAPDVVIENRTEGIVVCHSKSTNADIPAQIAKWAHERGLNSLNYDPRKLSCEGTFVLYNDSMLEVRHIYTTYSTVYMPIYICVSFIVFVYMYMYMYVDQVMAGFEPRRVCDCVFRH